MWQKRIKRTRGAARQAKLTWNFITEVVFLFFPFFFEQQTMVTVPHCHEGQNQNLLSEALCLLPGSGHLCSNHAVDHE